MWREAKFLAILGIGIFLVGCQGAKVKEAVESLKPEIGNIETQVNTARPVLEAVTDLEKETEGKLSKEKTSELLEKISGAQKAIATITGFDGKIATLKDSLSVLDKKATGTVKEDIATLSDKVTVIQMGIGEFRAADAKLNAMKSKLEETKETVKKAAPAKGEVKKPPAKKKTL